MSHAYSGIINDFCSCGMSDIGIVCVFLCVDWEVFGVCLCVCAYVCVYLCVRICA